MTCSHATDWDGQLVSVLVLNWNGERFLGPCLASVVRDACPHVEVVVVDNGSSDASLEIARQFPGVRVVPHGTNLGFSRGYNAAVPEVKGQFLVFLNNDTVVEQGWLVPLIETLRQQPTVGISGSMQLFYGTQIVNSVGGAFTLWTGGMDLGYGQPAASYRGRPYVDAFFASGAAMAIRRELFERLGGFEEYFFAYGEDIDLSWRARLLGYKIRTVLPSVVHHHHSASWGIFSPRKVRMVTRNQLIVNIGCLSTPNVLHSVPAYAVFALLKGAAMAVALRNINYLLATAAALIETGVSARTVWRRRRRIQASRLVPDREALRCEAFALFQSPLGWLRILRAGRQVDRERKVLARP